MPPSDYGEIGRMNYFSVLRKEYCHINMAAEQRCINYQADRPCLIWDYSPKDLNFCISFLIKAPDPLFAAMGLASKSAIVNRIIQLSPGGLCVVVFYLCIMDCDVHSLTRSSRDLCRGHSR